MSKFGQLCQNLVGKCVMSKFGRQIFYVEIWSAGQQFSLDDDGGQELHAAQRLARRRRTRVDRVAPRLQRHLQRHLAGHVDVDAGRGALPGDAHGESCGR